MTKSQLATPASPDGEGEHRKDRRIRMIERMEPMGVKTAKVVFIRSIVAEPGNDIEGEMVDRARP
jgi:hypothetical protein